MLTIADLLADVLREVLPLERRAMQNVLEVGLVLGAAVSLEPAGVNATCVRCELLTPMQWIAWARRGVRGRFWPRGTAAQQRAVSGSG